MPKRIINNLEKICIIACMWLLIKLNPIVCLSLVQKGDEEALINSLNYNQVETSKKPAIVTRLVFSLAEQQQQQHHYRNYQLNNSSSSSSSSASSSYSSSTSNLINEQSILFKRLLQTTTSPTMPTTTGRKYLEDELMMAASNNINNINDQVQDEDEESESESDYEDESETTQSSDNGKCRPERIEISLDLKSCGRVTLQTTECRGLCPSSEQLLFSKFKRRTCWACKPHKYVYKTYKIRCTDKSIMHLRLKTIDACSCFKHSEKLVPFS